MPDQVDLELLAKVGDRLELDGRRLDDACVVDEAGKTAFADGARDGVHRRRDRLLVRDLDDQRRHFARGPRRQRVTVLLTSHAREDPEALLRKVARRGGADAGGRPSDNNRAPVFEPVISHLEEPPLESESMLHRLQREHIVQFGPFTSTARAISSLRDDVGSWAHWKTRTQVLGNPPARNHQGADRWRRRWSSSRLTAHTQPRRSSAPCERRETTLG